MACRLDAFPDFGRVFAHYGSGVISNTGAVVPPGGLTARLLRRVRFDQHIWFGAELLDRLTQRYGRIKTSSHPARDRAYVAHVLNRAGVVTRRIRPPERSQPRGRRRLPDAEYVRLARGYTRLWRRGLRGRQLNKQLAADLDLTEPQARNRVSRARKYGFLQPMPLRGRATRS